MKALLCIVTVSILVGGKGLAQQGVHTPAPGSAEREAIMDVMRLDAYNGVAHPDPVAAHRNADGVFYKVYFLKVHGDWALTDVLPVHADGKGFAEPRWGLLHRVAGKWKDVDYMTALDPLLRSQVEADDDIDMTPATVRKLWRVFPDVPRDIFPADKK